MIKNIWAVGRNYADHAKELGNLLPKEPLFFLKSGSCIQTNGKLELLPHLGEIHHEVELALRLNSDLIPSEFTVALDLTDRTAQTKAKTEGLPWTRAKSFKGACALGAWRPFKSSEEFFGQEIELKINGEIRQKAPLSQMIFKPDQLLTALRKTFPVEAGDVLLTGTPSGVGRLTEGDSVECRIGNEIKTSWIVTLPPETAELG